MVLFIGYHASPRYNRASISAYGLIAQEPSPDQPTGVYVFSPYLWTDENMETSLHTEWCCTPTMDLWRVVYCGPMRPDPLVRNAVILPSVTSVTLVTGNEKLGCGPFS